MTDSPSTGTRPRGAAAEVARNGEAPGAPDVDAAVIGAGMAGLYMLYRLRGRGLSVRAFEAGDGVGGTWYWNRYPGARCDSESHIYSFSFSEELQREWEFTSTYPDQPEILDYLNYVADKFDLRRDIQFSTRISEAAYDADRNVWRVVAEDGSALTARFCISAMGCLSASNVPAIPGLDRFEGRWFHTSDWPREGVDFSDRRVGVIGTGATGIQVIPSIAPQAGHLTVFQRTANYIVPAVNTPLSPQTWREFQRHYPAIRERTRQTYACFSFDLGDRSAREASSEQRDRVYESDWRQGGLKFVFGSDFGDLLFDLESNDTASEFVRRKIRQIVRDPDTAEKLLPTNHPVGTKRPLVDTLGYYETFNRDNVSLVDLRATQIEEITERGVRTTEREYPLDDIVFATGFDAITGPLLKLNIRGESGQSLREKWANGPRTYLGVAVAGFPNFFMITGPGSPCVLSNMVVSIEQHVDWIADCIDYLRANGLDRIEATTQAEDDWIAHANDVAEATLLPMGESWWRGANIEGKPMVLMPYAGGAADYRARCEEVAAGNYSGFSTASQSLAGAKT
jgi:cation diffusion facilitator CzcD-associated flavoprotein CzcO